MIAILFNLGTQPPSLISGWDDFKLSMSEFIGYGRWADDWTADQETELERRVNETYRWILYPSTIPGEKVPHVWSHMEKFITITTEADVSDYDLDADVGSLSGSLTFSSSISYGPVVPTNEFIIRQQRAYATETGHPRMYATRWKEQTSGYNQRQEILLYPTPNGEYTLTGQTSILPPKLEQINPYPLGGPRLSQVMIEGCKAVGEAAKNGARGDQWGIFMQALKDAIEMDRGTNFDPTVGMMRGQGGRFLHGPIVSGSSYRYGPGGLDGSGSAIADGEFSLES